MDKWCACYFNVSFDKGMGLVEKIKVKCLTQEKHETATLVSL
jgi:hypothetical protein